MEAEASSIEPALKNRFQVHAYQVELETQRRQILSDRIVQKLRRHLALQFPGLQSADYGVTQFFPGVVLGLYSARAPAAGVFVRIITGIAISAFLVLTNRDPFIGLHAGFIGLCFNFVTCGTITLVCPAEHSGFEKRLARFVPG